MFLRATFSVGWFILGTFLHICGTIALCVLNFIVGMAGFTTGPDPNHDLSRLLQWVWTPLAMYSSNKRWADEADLILGILWSILVGVIVGYIAPYYRSKNRISSTSEANKSDVAGTPWVNDPSHTSNTKKDR
jgi:hypothetical protein